MSSTSSASPTELEQYAGSEAARAADLEHTAHRLAATLGHFAATCIEFSTGVDSSSYVIERFSQSELGWEPKRMGLALLVVTAPVAVVAGFVVVKPWLPASAADITPVHTLLTLAAALALSSLLCWSVLSMEARRLLPILGTGRLGIFIGMVVLATLAALDIVSFTPSASE